MEHDDQPAASNRMDGLVLGSSVQAGVIHGDVYVGAPETSATHGPAGDPTHQVRSLLRAQVQAAQELPRMLPGARRPALSDVYVRQDLSSSVETPRPEPRRPTPILDGHGQLVEVPGPPVVRIAVRPPVRTVREALDGLDHLVVTGGAGQGKSTLSLRLAADIAAHWLDAAANPLGETVVPLRLTARELAARLDLPFPDALADSVRADYGALLRLPISSDVLRDRVAGCRWLLLVDGLDEVADAGDRDRLVKVLASCASESPYRIVLTTRPIEGAALAPLHRIGATRYELQTFDDDALCRFAENWFGDADLAERFRRQIRAAHLDDLVRVPLLATIAAIVFQSRRDLPLPDNEYELYEAYFSFLRSIRPADSPFEPHRARLLEHLGVVRVETDASLVAAARDWVRGHAETEHLPVDWPDQLTAFLVAVGPLVIRGDDLMFLHHSFAEHLAATATARQLPTTFAPHHEDFARLLHAARPDERGRYARSVALHYTRLCPSQADPLLRALHAGDAEQHLLAARLLAKRMPATTPVVDAFLGTVRGWAVTTHSPAGDILAHTCRATQHPGLAAWLAKLMRDDGMPLGARTEAAAALAVRLRGTHLPAAIRFLHTMIDNTQAPVAVRLAAAEALSDSGAAERAAAERGLRSVLEDPAGFGADYRTAAVILAAFGRDERDFAVAALTRLLDDRDTAPGIVVEAATGLIEIGPEFHERAADAFRLVLRDRVHHAVGRADAALGMASLGPDHLAEAVTALNDIIGDRRRSWSERASVAEVLGRLGPQYRQAGGESVQAMLAEPDIDPAGIRTCAAQLADFGPIFRADAEHRLRSLITDRRTPFFDVMLALNALGRLGSEHLAEVARRSWELIDEIGPDTDTYIGCLGHITNLGEPHRTAAIERLRAHLADVRQSPASRCGAASWLIDAGPELHAEAARYLLAIAEAEATQNSSVDAWHQLVRLGPQYHDRALDALLRATTVVGAEPVVWFGQASWFAFSDAERDRIADAMSAMIGDPRRTVHERLSGLSGLIRLGPRFHRRAVEHLCVLLKSATTMAFDFRYTATLVSLVGIGLRERVAHVLLDLMRDPWADINRVYAILIALEALGFTDSTEVQLALSMVARYSGTSVRWLHALELRLAVNPASAAAIAAEILAPDGAVPSSAWHRSVGQLAHFGVDVASRLRELLADPDTEQRVRWASAEYLAKMHPEDRVLALAELKRQLINVHRRPMSRSVKLPGYVNLEPIAWTEAVSDVAAVVGDERLNVNERCRSAYYYTELDRTATIGVFAFLGRMADDPRLTPVERAEAVNQMRRLGTQHAVVGAGLLAVAALDAEADGSRRALIGALPRGLRTRTERSLLDDRVLRIKDRVPDPDLWDDLPLAPLAVAAVREVMTAPEFPVGERIAAAKALAWLDIRAAPEATAYLDGQPADSPVARRAQQALMELGTARGREVWREVERVALDQTMPLRVRRAAVELVLAVTPRTPSSVAGVLREIATDPGTSERKRAEALLALGRFDGLDALRAMRDDDRTNASVRRYVARELCEYDPEDWTVAARVMAAIAADPNARPAIRRRAAESLSYRGRAGRDQAVELLRAIATDDRLPVGARRKAMTTLGEIAPSMRGELMTMLRALLTTAKPLQRRGILLAIGEMRPEEAALELLAMARDIDHGAVVRVRCAEGAVRLWRECRDAAALVVRAVAWDAGVAWHVRRRAACHLARWSELCRADARKLIRDLDSTGRTTL